MVRKKKAKEKETERKNTKQQVVRLAVNITVQENKEWGGPEVKSEKSGLLTRRHSTGVKWQPQGDHTPGRL